MNREFKLKNQFERNEIFKPLIESQITLKKRKFALCNSEKKIDIYLDLGYAFDKKKIIMGREM